MKKQNYAAEIREELVRLAAEGHSIASLARDYEPSAATIHKWVRQARQEQANRTGLDLKDVEAVYAENRRLKRDVAILKKAAAWFAKDQIDP